MMSALRTGALTFVALVAAGAAAAACQMPPHETTKMPQTVRLVDGGTPLAGAWFDGPTTRYPHGVLGDAIEPTMLLAYSPHARSSCGEIRAASGADHVFEDVAPRQVDLDNDGTAEIIVVRSHQNLGAQLAIYKDTRDGALSLIATTPYIGRQNRWLAPLGAADLDGDGAIEIAYVDRPHLAKILRVWRFEKNALTEVARMSGFTNHRIGETDIAGGIRTCAGVPEIVVANADWSQIKLVRLSGGSLTSTTWGPHKDRTSFTRALNCS